MLDLWDRHRVKVTSHMIGEAVQRHPELANEIVQRGHEAAGHGPHWSSQYAMNREEEREFLVAGTEMVEAATRQRPVGYNCTGVAFLRKDAIARWALESPLTLRESEPI
jgi:peptidoglycan/xylan/chitin deacetylase (PgdA/CDA1 family)